MKRTMSIVVRGKQRLWSFNFDGDPKYLDEWWADGLEVNVIEGVIPFAVAGTPLAKPLVGIQRFWRWLRLW